MIRSLIRKLLGENLTREDEKYAKINGIIIILMFLVSIVMLFLLPKEIPIIHEGAKSYFVPTILGIWLVPVISIVINYTLIKQKRISIINSILLLVILLASTYYYITLI